MPCYQPPAHSRVAAHRRRAAHLRQMACCRPKAHPQAVARRTAHSKQMKRCRPTVHSRVVVVVERRRATHSRQTACYQRTAHLRAVAHRRPVSRRHGRAHRRWLAHSWRWANSPRETLSPGAACPYFQRGVPSRRPGRWPEPMSGRAPQRKLAGPASLPAVRRPLLPAGSYPLRPAGSDFPASAAAPSTPLRWPQVPEASPYRDGRSLPRAQARS